MAQNFPTAAQLSALFTAIYEFAIGEDAPLNDKADIRIRAKVWAMIAGLMNREVIDSSLQSFIITASRETLINVFGKEYLLPIKEEVATVLTAALPASTGTTIDAGTDFVSDDTGIIYYNPVPVIAVADVATLSLTARTAGVIGNLNNGQTLSVSRTFAGQLSNTATVTATTTVGANAEETDVYRQRLLDIARNPGGGGNSADFRNWAQLQEGVKRGFPYSGPDPPPARVVFVEADESIDPDGIAPAPLLASAKLTIITDADTERHRQPLGITNATLDVLSIFRTSFYPTISGLVTPAGQEAQVKSEVDDAVDSYFLSLFPFVEGLDIASDRNDLITAGSIIKPVQQVLEANSSSMQTLTFSDVPGGTIPTYLLQQGEKAKNGGVTYV